MSDKLKGNIFYEILIVVLVIVLIWTILYPTKVWENEAEVEKVCHTRMEAIQQMEFRYIGLNEDFVYTDSLPKLRQVVMADPDVMSALDSIIIWDGIVMPNDLETIISQKQFPDELRTHIHEKLMQGEPLGNLTRWDSLGEKLVEQLNSILDTTDATQANPLDSAIVWKDLFGINDTYQIIDSTDVRGSIKNRMRTGLRREEPTIEISNWRYFRPNFYKKLAEIIEIAQREVIWKSGQKDDWEKIKEKEYKDELASLPEAEKDTLWSQLQRSIWDKEREVIWRKERKKLWKVEEEEWVYANEITWKRVLNERWEKDRRIKWEDETKKTLIPLPEETEEPADSTETAEVVEVDTTAIDSGLVYLEIFQERKSKLWRGVVDTIRAQEFELWKKSNKKQVDEIIQDLWVSARRITWESEKYQTWLIEQEEDKENLWNKIFEETWIVNKDLFWDRELESGSEKKEAMRRLDAAVEWRRVIDNNWLGTVVDQLQLPNNKEFLKKLKREKIEGESTLYSFGIVGLFRDMLIDSIAHCPLVHEPYLLYSVDTTVVKNFQIECPIQETYIYNEAKSDSTKTIAAIKEDPITREKTASKTKISIIRKLLGGGKVKPHGTIETDKKSWDKRGV